MANTIYKTTGAPGAGSTLQELINLFSHLQGLGLTLVSIRVASNKIEVTVNNPIPPEQVPHLGLTT